MTEIILPTKTVPTYATASSLPLSAPDGALAVTLDDDYIHVFNLATATWLIASTPGGGGGTVTSVAMTVPSFLNVGGSPVTSMGTLAVTLNTETANKVFSGPTTGAAANPTFRALVAADIPSISSGLTGVLPVANGGTGVNTFTPNRGVASDFSGNLYSLAVTDVELNYSQGLTGYIQSQLNALATGVYQAVTVTLNGTNISAANVTISPAPTSNLVVMQIQGGVPAVGGGIDFLVFGGGLITWSGFPLQSILIAGDVLTFTYK